MKVRVSPTIDLDKLCNKLSNFTKEELKDKIKRESFDFGNCPFKEQHYYELTNGHILAISVEEFA